MFNVNYNQAPTQILRSANRQISVFNTTGENIDPKVVESFGEEWAKFHSFDEKDLDKISKEYFDILNDKILNKESYCLDIGCGSGRWTKTLVDRAGFIEAIDPSKAILAADVLLKDAQNVRLSVASTDNIPFPDEAFDFAMSIGVLHHIPDTAKAMMDCVKKVKKNGFFYVYLYYSLDNKGPAFKTIFFLSTGIRKVVSVLPAKLKKFSCDVLAISLYMPFVGLSRLFYGLGLKGLSLKVPLSTYRDKSFYIIRNDALDRFGTRLEQRFSRTQIIEMMKQSGLDNIVVSEKMPYWHALGQKI